MAYFSHAFRLVYRASAKEEADALRQELKAAQSNPVIIQPQSPKDPNKGKSHVAGQFENCIHALKKRSSKIPTRADLMLYIGVRAVCACTDDQGC